MARWTGDPEVTPVLEAGDAWRERCFVGSTSVLTQQALWTAPNLSDLLTRYADHPIEGDRDFLDKLREQLAEVSRRNHEAGGRGDVVHRSLSAQQRAEARHQALANPGNLVCGPATRHPSRRFSMTHISTAKAAPAPPT